MTNPGTGALQLIKSEDGTFDISKLPIGKEEGTAFGYGDRMFQGVEGSVVFDYGDWEARDIEPFLRKDYKARQILNVLQLPISSAERNIKPAKGDKGEFEWLSEMWSRDPVNGGCATPLEFIIDQSLSAIAYRRCYFEKVFRLEDDGKVFYEKVAFRPQTTCRLARHIQNGDLLGFQQQAYSPAITITSGIWPINIPLKRAHIYIHGQRNDPINGVSDMEIPYWSYRTKQKIMLLWFQFLEGVALPRMMVGAQDLGDAQKIARQAAGLRNSGILPYGMGAGPNSVKFDVLSMAGQGAADQFQHALTYLDTAAVDSVLAGFLNLTGTAAARGFGSTGGSYALSKDASDFFLQSEEAKTREVAHATRTGLFAPIIRYNFGKDAKVPLFEFEPLNSEDNAASIELLKALLIVPPGTENPPPTYFVSELAEQVANSLGLDGDKVADEFEKAATEAKKKAAAMGPMGASPMGQGVAGMTGAVNAATNAVKLATPGSPMDPSTVTSAHGRSFLKSIGALS